MKKVGLSTRLSTVCSLVTKGNRVCDVGCDHGFVPIYLIQESISPFCVAMDVGEGPLSQAREHVAQYDMEDRIVLRLSDGLDKFQIGEADSLIIAGMGGPLMLKILTAYPEKTAHFKELILQPQSEIYEFRKAMSALGYRSVAECMVEEDGKFYPMMKMVKEDSADMIETTELDDHYGRLLLQNKDAVLYRYLEKEEANYKAILERLEGDERNQSRFLEIKLLLERNQAAKGGF